MARKKDRFLQDLVDSLSGDVRKAFIASIQGFTNDLIIGELIAAIKAQDITRILQILEIGPEYFAPLDRAIRNAYAAGGEAAAAALVSQARGSGVRLVHRFNDRNPRAEAFLASRSSMLITQINNGVRESVQDLLSDAVLTGTSPRRVALDLVGRINRKTGKREGGLIGLTTQQRKRVTNPRWQIRNEPAGAVEQLRSGDPKMMAQYLSRKARPAQYDAIVKRAIKSGGTIDAETAAKIANAYETKLLRIRGETIARTELKQALGSSQYEGVQQLIDSGKIEPQDVTLIWDSAEFQVGVTRDHHIEMDGQEVGWGELFRSPRGFQLLFPGDSSNGADGAEVINCRCIIRVVIDFIQASARNEQRLAA